MNPEHFYSMSQKECREAGKILVIDPGFLGDSIHLIPALWELRRHHPRAALHVLTSPLGAEVLHMVSCVDQAWVFPLGPPSPPFWKHWDIIKKLRREHFDAAYNFSGTNRAILLTALSGAGLSMTHETERKHFWTPWLIQCVVPEQDRSLPVFEQRRQVLAACGFTLAPAQFTLKVPSLALDWAEERVPAGSVHLSPNASMHLNEWPLEHTIALVRGLLARNPLLTVVVTGSSKPREKDRLRQIAEEAGDARVRVLTGLTLAQLAGVLTRCRLHVGPDPGVTHLAYALGIPTFSIFRDHAGLKEWLPCGENHLYRIAACRCAGLKEPTCRNAPHARCLADIKPDDVLQALDHFQLSKPSPEGS
jgi:ADP-heptose:LPS heptosyltransferase